MRGIEKNSPLVSSDSHEFSERRFRNRSQTIQWKMVLDHRLPLQMIRQYVLILRRHVVTTQLLITACRITTIVRPAEELENLFVAKAVPRHFTLCVSNPLWMQRM
jgi:hypothetical protein